MKNPFTKEVLLKNVLFNKEIDSFKDDTSYLHMIAQAISTNEISHHNFFKLCNVVSKEKNITPLYDDDLKNICNKSINVFGKMTTHTDVLIRKLKLTTQVNDLTLKTQLFLNFAKELTEHCSNLRVQTAILSNWKLISNDIKKITPFITDIVSPNKKLELEEITYSIIKLDSWPMAIDYNYDNKNIELFVYQFVDFVKKNFPHYIDHTRISQNKRYTHIYTQNNEHAQILIDFLEFSLNKDHKDKLTFNSKDAMTEFSKIQLEYQLTTKKNTKSVKL